MEEGKGEKDKKKALSAEKRETLEELSHQFHEALIKGDVREVHQTLKELKKLNGLTKGTGRLLRNWKDDDSMTALHVAAERNHLALAQFLVSKSPELVNEQKNKTGCTPLVLAGSRGHLEICKFLLTVKKVDVNLVNIDSTSALHYLVRYSPTTSEHIRTLSEIYKLLMKKKAELDGENFRGETPVHQATRVGNEGAIGVLAKSGANINKQNKNGETALHYAVMLGRTYIVQKLLEYGADKNIKRNDGLTPLDVAREEGRTEIADMIQYWSGDEHIRTEESKRIALLRKYEKMVILLNEVHFFAKALSIFTDKADYDRLSKALIHISVPTGSTIPLIRNLIEVEFEKNKHTSSVLRGNCPASKVMGAFSRQIGQEYLINCIGDVVRELCLDDKVSFELDENKMKETDNVEELLLANKEALVKHSTAVLHKIISDEKMAVMPREIRAIAGFIAEYARKYCPDKEASLVGGFIMLRLINPSLVAPESYGMLPLGKNPSPKARRNLILLSKLLQNLSNDVEFGVKEPHMAVVNEFIVSNRDAMIEFLRKVATDPLTEDDKEQWADCKTLVVKPIVDITMLDLKELNFLHRLLIQYREELQKLLNTEKESGLMSETEFDHAMLLFKALDSLGQNKEIKALLAQENKTVI